MVLSARTTSVRRLVAALVSAAVVASLGAAWTAPAQADPVAPQDAVSGTLTVGQSPSDIAVDEDGTYAYVVTYQSRQLVKVRLSDLTVDDSLTLPSGNGMTVTVHGGNVYVTTTTHLYRVNAATFPSTPDASVPIPDYGAGLAIAWPYAYVTHHVYNSISKIDLRTTMTLVSTIGSGANYPMGIAIDPAKQFAYVVHTNSSNVTKIRLSDDSVMGSTPVGAQPYYVAIDGSGTYAYVPNASAENSSTPPWLSRVDLGTFAVDDTVLLPFTWGYGVAVNPAGTTAYVSQARGGDNVAKIALDTSMAIDDTLIHVGSGANAIAVSPTQPYFYTANGNNGSGTTITQATIDPYTPFAAVALTSLDPVSGPLAGGTQVEIAGEDLRGLTSVRFGGAAATIDASDDSTATVTTPAYLDGGAVTVSVTTSGGTGFLPAAFTYQDAPVIDSLDDTSGPVSGDDTVQLIGSNMAGATAVVFGGASATIVDSDDTSVTVHPPTGSAGIVDVIVFTPATGTSSRSNTLEDAYTYVAAPVATSMDDTAGPIGGGDTVTITGTSLAGATVRFDDTVASIVSNTDDSVVVLTPPHAAGIVPVTVTTIGGTATLGTSYRYQDVPSLTAITPAQGQAAGGQTATITGQGLLNAVVTFDDSLATIVSNTDDTIVVTTPGPAAAGSATVTVTTPGGDDTLPFAFVAAPQPVSLDDTFGPLAGGETVIISGTLLAGATVTFDDTTAIVTSSTDDSIVVLVPARSVPGAVDVDVTTSGGTATLASAYTYVSSPTLTSLDDSSGPLSGGETVTISGVGLLGAISVTFDDTAATILSGSDDTIAVTVPARATPGTSTVRVTNSVGASNGLPYLYQGTPVITSIDRTSGPTAGSSTVVISGTDLSHASVTFGAAGTVTANTSTSITVTTPPGAAGTVTVNVTTPGGLASAGSYAYQGSPTITSLDDTRGPTSGDDTVTIQGTNLAGTTVVTFGGVPATVVSNNSTTLVVRTGARSAGTVNVVVETPGTGTSVRSTTRSNGYTYVAAPVITNTAPEVGPLAGGTSVTITGSNLGSATVSFDDSSASVTASTSTSITVTSPGPRPAGDDSIVVTTDGGKAYATFTYVPAPTITGVSPNRGSLNGTPSVVITGTNFITGTVVSFDGVTAQRVGPVTSNQITVNAPARVSVGAVNVSVVTVGGDDSLTNGFTYVAAPVITSLDDTAGPLAGDDTVIIAGVNLANSSQVTFDDTPATIISSSDDTIEVTTPARATAGLVKVAVTTPGGTVETLQAYRYQGVPSALAKSPMSGPLAGGTTVVITGQDLFNASVTFDDSVATISSNTGTRITLTSPGPRASGSSAVSVTTPGGTAGVGTFVYQGAPTITSLDDTRGPASGDDTVTIFGTNLAGATRVSFGANNAPTPFVSNDDTSVTVRVPAGTGTVDVSVYTPNVGGGFQVALLPNAYTYVAAPTVTSVSPAAGPDAGGTAVTIHGTAFTTATSVSFDDTVVGSFTVVDDTTITTTAPAGLGTVDVSVTIPVGGEGTRADAFRYFPLPTVVSLDDTQGPVAGGESITISGTNLTGATSVKFDDTVAIIGSGSDDTISVTVPAGVPGAVDVTVVTPGGDDSLVNAYTYVALPVPTSLAPSSGSTAGGTTLTISGTSLSNATVSLGGTPVALTSNTATTITLTTPARSAGGVAVSVTTVGGTVSAGTFTYQAPTPPDPGPGPGPGPGPSPTVPGAPVIGTAVAGNAQATVTWTAPSSTGGSAITSYRIEQSTDDATWTVAVASTGDDSTEATITGLAAGLTYRFRVSAINAVGVGPASSASNSVSSEAVPGAPEIGAPLAGKEQVTVTWTAPSADGGTPVTSYVVEESTDGGATWMPSGSASGADTSLAVTGLTVGATYVFRVAAVNKIGTGGYSAASAPVTVATTPRAPRIVGLTAGNRSVTVKWAVPISDGGSPIIGYRVESSANNGATWNEVILLSSVPEMEYVMTGLTNGKKYIFKVSAINQFGFGLRSKPSRQMIPLAVQITVTGSNPSGTVEVSGLAPNYARKSLTPYFRSQGASTYRVQKQVVVGTDGTFTWNKRNTWRTVEVYFEATDGTKSAVVTIVMGRSRPGTAVSTGLPDSSSSAYTSLAR